MCFFYDGIVEVTEEDIQWNIILVLQEKILNRFIKGNF
jgi:hypothetical protein